MEMLNILDAILTFVFHWLIPAALMGAVGFFAFVGLAAFWNVNKGLSFVELGCGLLVMSLICYSYFTTRASFAELDDEPGSVAEVYGEEKAQEVNDTFGLVGIIFTGGLVLIARWCRIPFFVILPIFAGFMFF
jgi:hypothetical protein